MIDQNNTNRKQFGYYFRLSLALWIVIFCTYFWWPLAGKAMVEYWDGQPQHFVAFIYTGKYIRELLNHIFIQHNFNFPLYDFSIGYGQNIIGTMHYYALGDPFNLLSVVTRPKHAEFMFSLAIMLRLYLSGIAFSIYAKSKKFANYQAFIGSLIYVFCGFSIGAASKHPYFINPMIYLPLLCLGLDRIFEKKGSKLFVFMVFISVISNFYFFYMLTLLIFLYALYHFSELYSFKDIKLFVNLLLKTIFNYIVGILMGSIIFVPVVLQFLNSARGSIHSERTLFYTKNFYLSFIKNLISPVYSGEGWTLTAYFPIVLLTLAIMITMLKKNKETKRDLLSVLIMGVFLGLPFFGSLFNGFSYSANRWIFGFTFFLAFLTGKYLPYILTIVADKKLRLFFGSLIGVFSLVLLIANFNRESTPYIGLVFFLLYSTCVLVIQDLKLLKPALCVLTFINALVYVSFFSNIKINPALYANYTDKEIVKNDYWAYKTSAMTDIAKKDHGWYRYELSPEKNYRAEINNALLRNPSLHGTSFYFSLSNKNTFDFNKAIENNITSDYEYYGMDNRSILGTLANSKYFVTESNVSKQYIPYGYTKVKTEKKAGEFIDIYKNTNFLPFGYTYDSFTIGKIKNPFQLMETEAKSAIVEKKIDNLSRTNQNSVQLSDFKKIPYAIAKTDGVQIKDNHYFVSKENATITLKMESNIFDPSNKNLLLRIKGIGYPNYTPKKLGFNLAGDQTETALKVSYSDLQKTFIYRNKFHIWYTGIDNITLNLGEPIPSNNEVNLLFTKTGDYSFKDLGLYEENLAGLDNKIRKLKSDHLTNLEFNPNTIKGEIYLQKRKLLLLTVPYEKGWKAYDNGKEIPTVKANLMYTALNLNKGKHKIELIYKTPGLQLGIIFSILGWLIFLGLIVQSKLNSVY
ncbi:YfhO family protein [Enterococcus sp. CSURQ0835]|uniref:YfhO family protein n=1 Tax=Enterococcus sp. CSURQ0835 TaxID=2681394 RepID=UPI001F31C72C|nr:YfhO family protein [Enterococcus sp. CSURQ0835]